MTFGNEKKILNIIKYAPPMFILSIGIIISIFLYLNNISIYNKEKIKIRETHIKTNKELIKKEVLEVYNYIQKEQKETEKSLKLNLEIELDKAHSIISSLYKRNTHLSKNEVKKIIKDALRDIRFNKGRGYFFIYDMQSNNVLLPTHPHLENKSFINHQDARGDFIIQKMATKMKVQEKSFFKWYWFKPDNKKVQKKKIGITRRFEPLDWFIGTGEYVEDFEKNIQEKVLNHIRKIRYGKNGYIFIIDYNTVYLSHMRASFWGKSAITNNDTKSITSVIQTLIKIAKAGEGYSTYVQIKKPGSNLSTTKLSFVKGLENWSWMIGTGFYEDDFKKTLEQKKKELDKHLEENIKHTIIIFLLLTIILIFISIFISKKLKKQFQNYKHEIKLHLEENTKQQDIISQQSKMAAMGEMISNIAHQWRQPLSAITTASSGMRLQKELGMLDDKDFYKSIDDINTSANHLSSTIDDFRNFFKSDKSYIPFNINKLVEKTIRLLEAQFKNKEIKIIKDIEDIIIKNLENEFIQVLINILNNARDELIKCPLKEPRFIFITVKRNQKDIIVEIKDNAGGIPNKILKRVFEPYFTTKYKRQGTGIGLYMSKEIIEKNMHGSLDVENTAFKYKNNEYKGAKFIIQLPDKS